MAVRWLKPGTLSGAAVLVRLDLNEPVEHGTLLDDFRIRASVPTVQMLVKDGCSVIICAHLGRPDGKPDPELSLRPVGVRLAELLDLKFVETAAAPPTYPVPTLAFYTGSLEDDAARDHLKGLPKGSVVLLENIRFYRAEEHDVDAFADRLAGLADAYVNDAFSVSHHPSASVTEVAQLLPSYGGPLLEREVRYLGAVLTRHTRPFSVLLGGMKISDKVETIHNLAPRADHVLLGGGLANLFFLALGTDTGISKVERDATGEAFAVMKTYRSKILLPKDVAVADEGGQPGSYRVCLPHEVRPNEQILDVGPKTILEYAQILKASKTVVWNGPLGLFEKKPFDTGTSAIAKVLGGIGKRTAYVVAGGGETVDAIRGAHQAEHYDHVSTGGGSMIEFLAGKTLPGIQALER